VVLTRGDTTIGATLVRPSEQEGPLPGWIAIGGVSRKGRFHPQLRRFAEALASTGAAVLVPEIPEWRELDVSPKPTLPTIRASVDFLDNRADVSSERYGAIGFSFGAPGLALSASNPGVADRMAGLVLFGGYCSLDRTLGCLMTGQHEWEDVSYCLSPDPYGRWVLASNYLARVPGLSDAGDVAAALRSLASEASDRRISAWEPHHDAMIAELRETLPQERRRLFDCFATVTTEERPPAGECLEIGRAIAQTCREAEPLLDPEAMLAGVRVPTQVIHGRGDRLVPFTEGLRFMDQLPDSVQRGATVTSMFNHSKDCRPAGKVEHAMEAARLFGALKQLVTTV
jgi:pimeloyl-ACP methyl ester carboxylesterase